MAGAGPIIDSGLDGPVGWWCLIGYWVSQGLSSDSLYLPSIFCYAASCSPFYWKNLMCLYMEPSDTPPVAKVAEEDIPVIKVLGKLNGELYSPFQNTLYPSNVTLFDALDTPIRARDPLMNKYGEENLRNDYWEVNVGLHAYVDTEKADGIIELLGAAESLYFCDIPKRNGIREKVTVHAFNAIIPKGAKYFIGIDGDMVSDQLHVLEEVNIKKVEIKEPAYQIKMDNI